MYRTSGHEFFGRSRSSLTLSAVLAVLLVTAALLTLTSTTTAPAAGNGSPVSGSQESSSRDRTSVIVQAVSSEAVADIQATVTQLGGVITQDLHIINAFAADVPASAVAEIAAHSGVKCVTPDSQMLKTGTADQFTTWATTIGTSLQNGFRNSNAAIDSALGPNGTYAVAYAKTGAFGGFTGEITPGNAITKVEVALRAYVPTSLGWGQDPVVSVSVDGVAGNTVTCGRRAFDSLVGASSAGTVYVDVTGTRSWTWGDFGHAIEVRIDQSKFNYGVAVYYDAVGLRVTSDLGSDATAQAADTTTETAGPITGTAQLNVFNDVIGSTTVWNQSGYLQGSRISVAVVDSGVIRTQDLQGRGKINVNFNPGYHTAADLYGHGTFVAGIIAGNGKTSGGKYMGVAPRASLLNIRVSDDQGGCSESYVVAGLQWVLEHKTQYNIRVVNLSLNSAVAQSYRSSPLDAACEVLWFNGITVVASAGNKGTATLFPPANDPFVITVGATDDKGTSSVSDDTLAPFSSYGVSEVGLVKPELVAPGTKIIGLLPENDKLTMSKNKPDNRINSTYFRMSGTSVSAPMVTGAIALLLQDEPYLTPDQIKYRLMATANKSWPGYNAATCGAGYLNIRAAISGTTTQSANTGLAFSDLLTTGSSPVTGSVMWNSVMWNSVMWNSVMWNSVMWNSVMWNSDYWGGL
jgi:serine protease AprX